MLLTAKNSVYFPERTKKKNMLENIGLHFTCESLKTHTKCVWARCLEVAQDWMISPTNCFYVVSLCVLSDST